MKTIEQINDDILNYIFGSGKLSEEYTDEMVDIVWDAHWGIHEVTKELSDGRDTIDVNNPLFDEWDKKTDDIIFKAAEKIFIMKLNGALYCFNADASIVEDEKVARDITKFIEGCDKYRILTEGEDFNQACARLDLDSACCIHEWYVTNGEHLTICFEW